MKKNFLIFCFISFLSTSLLADNKRPVVAEINGEPIFRDIFEQEWKQQSLFVGNEKLSQKKVLNTLIDRQIGIQKALKNQLDKNEVVLRKMQDVLFHAQVSKDLEDKFKTIKVTDADVKDYYTNFPEYRTAHILFRIPAESSETDRNMALTQAIKVYNQLQKDPSLFSALANEYSQTDAAKNGGDVGFQLADSYTPEYFKEIHGKKIGYVSSPIRTQFGYHIVKLIAKKEFNEINKQLYQDIVYKIKRNKLLEQYFSSARKSATIVILDSSLK
ncbi:MAG: hypothetical protein A2381_08925 [Bdellovibrionales bacterium RIFOXYB1_FULL_37_110]|nr:MAG: hypothetical protein A2181_09120 [Bdellovibrionales bacterium RIFOXYA1_FULL_38_20]OFZ50351.1 MAG: hypothetical protein A2417_09025 [Bdellovibrionales bacterium RIFOXYC1_FULL_37_79]OFZ58983.1 MAG: hypothetical protein A2328_06170 [Bdellovibrionales bacterium RIFOXYB2_FULL_36_6]OFZ60960.1 MAG: hypothetical protein A2381_08925 [Bdellovibrionales bacterium RIFOXYB1_FULL_37_110]OFZ63704.1 MAG: hypothetical protein A2577_08045 [Bdellovibrionales bacterium RIFOXYD1_FULL_36_51]